MSHEGNVAFMALFFEGMNFLYTNKIQKFVVLSIFFHLLLFLTWSSFAILSKNQKELEIFIMEENSGSKNIKESKKTDRPINKEIKKITSTIVEETKVNSPVEPIVEEKIVDTSHSTVHIADSQQGVRGKSKDTIIDAEFGTATGPKFLHREIPVYPQVARRLGKEGKVILRLTLNEKGELINIEVLESAPYGFTESAVEAIKRSKFLPATKDGIPIASRAILPIRFVLKN